MLPLDIGGFPARGVPVIVNPATGFPFGLFHRVDEVVAGNLDQSFTLGAVPYQNGLTITRIRSGVAYRMRLTTDYTISGVNVTLTSGATALDVYVFDLWTATPNPAAASNPNPVDPLFANVTSLLHLDGANNATTTTDVIVASTWTFTAAAKLATAWSKFGASSLFLDTGGYIGSNSHANFGFGSGDYCVEMFTNLGSQGGGGISRVLYEGRGGGATGIVLYSTVGGDSKLQAWSNSSLIIASSAQTYSAGDHIALYRASGIIYIAKNGVVVATAADSRTYSSTATAVFGGNPTPQYETGYLDEIRITKGNARYSTSGFTPPSASFPNH